MSGLHSRSYSTVRTSGPVPLAAADGSRTALVYPVAGGAEHEDLTPTAQARSLNKASTPMKDLHQPRRQSYSCPSQGKSCGVSRSSVETRCRRPDQVEHSI